MDRVGNIVYQAKSVYEACKEKQNAGDINDIPWYQWLLQEFVDKEEDYLEKFLKGNIGGGLLNLLGATLSLPQSLYLNVLNAATGIIKDEAPQFVYSMNYHDYANEQKRKFGGGTIFDFTEELKTKGFAGDIVGTIIEIAVELLSDPLFVWSVSKSMGQGVAKKAAKSTGKAANSADDVAKGAGKVADDMIDGIKIIDGKVGEKIPVDEYKAIRKASVTNPDADSLTLGKYTNDTNSYTKRAGDSSYFDLSDDWGKIKEQYGLTNDEMFEYFNKPILNDAIFSGKTIRFSHNPLDYVNTSLRKEWEYIKKAVHLTNENLIFEEGFWYVR